MSRKTVAPLESAEPRAKRKLDLGAPGGEPAPSVEMQKLYNSNYQQDLPHEAPRWEFVFNKEKKILIILLIVKVTTFVTTHSNQLL